MHLACALPTSARRALVAEELLDEIGDTRGAGRRATTATTMYAGAAGERMERVAGSFAGVVCSGGKAVQRRLGAVRAALMAGGGEEAAALLEVASEIAQTAGLSLADEDGEWGEIYKEIGVTPVINATGSVTILGGSTPHPEVSAAMDKANSAFVPLWELQKVAGASIAEMVGVPSAMVSSGCGGAMMLAAAAALAGDDVAAIEALPDTSSLAKDEILIMKRQRYKFDRCFEAAGAKLVDWGEAEGAISIDEMVAAIGPRTCAVAYVANENHADPYPYDYSRGPLPDLQELIDVAHAHGLYVIVDAAGQIYPLDSLSKYVKMGADASCVACKYMGASQSSGVLLGQTEFVHKALLNSFTGYEAPGLNGDLSIREEARGAGRPAKVDRQEMVGTWAAIKRWTKTVDHEERKARIKEECLKMVAPFDGVAGITAHISDSEYGHQPYGIMVHIDDAVTGVDVNTIMEDLKTKEPRVWVRSGRSDSDPSGRSANPTTIAMHPFALRPSELTIPAERIVGAIQR